MTSEIVKTINTLANNLGMEVVAEGVETEGQLAQLKSLRCRYGQGHLFSRALDAAAASLFVQNHQMLAFSTLVDDGRGCSFSTRSSQLDSHLNTSSPTNNHVQLNPPA